jgi:putative sigma-54 modulation protein
MRIQITGKNIALSEAVKDYVDKKMTALNKFYNEKIIRAEVVVGVSSDHHQKGNKFFAECKLDVPGKNLFALKEENSLYKAVDKIRDYLELELKKYKLKQRVSEKDKKNNRAQKEYKIEY